MNDCLGAGAFRESILPDNGELETKFESWPMAAFEVADGIETPAESVRIELSPAIGCEGCLRSGSFKYCSCIGPIQQFMTVIPPLSLAFETVSRRHVVYGRCRHEVPKICFERSRKRTFVRLRNTKFLKRFF
jgi:hypothetical protein